MLVEHVVEPLRASPARNPRIALNIPALAPRSTASTVIAELLQQLAERRSCRRGRRSSRSGSPARRRSCRPARRRNTRPSAATSPIDTMTGLPRWRARSTSRQIVSEATAEPPGLSMRKRIARTSLSRDRLAERRGRSRVRVELVVADQRLPPAALAGDHARCRRSARSRRRSSCGRPGAVEIARQLDQNSAPAAGALRAPRAIASSR